MTKMPQISFRDLQEAAERSEHREAFRVLEGRNDYRIGVGARLETPHQPSFFIEVLVYICQRSSKVDLVVLQEKLELLKELQARGYSMICQDYSCISCETTISSENIASEHEFLKSVTKRLT